MKKLLVLAVIVLLVFLFFSYFKDRRKTLQNNTVSALLPVDLNSKLIVKNGRVEHIQAVSKTAKGLGDKADKSKLKKEQGNKAEKIVFNFPPEGGFELTQEKSGVYHLEIEKYGFTFKPYIGAGYSVGRADLSPAAGLRLFYYENWGAGALYLADSGMMFSIERRLSIKPFSNTIVFAGFNKKTAALGAAVFL